MFGNIGEWLAYKWWDAHCRLLDAIDEREGLARIRWANAVSDAERADRWMGT